MCLATSGAVMFPPNPENEIRNEKDEAVQKPIRKQNLENNFEINVYSN